MRLTQVITRRKRLVIASLVVVALIGDWWRRRRQYELQVIGHWIFSYDNHELSRKHLPIKTGYTFFEDGTGFERHDWAQGHYYPPAKIRWWLVGQTIQVERPGRTKPRDLLSLMLQLWRQARGRVTPSFDQLVISGTENGTELLSDPPSKLIRLALEIIPEDRQMGSIR